MALEQHVAIPAEGPVVDTAEVDELAWLPPAVARARLSYDDERAVLDVAAELHALDIAFRSI